MVYFHDFEQTLIFVPNLLNKVKWLTYINSCSHKLQIFCRYFDQAAQQQEQHAAALAANEQAMLHSLGVHTTQQPVSGSGIRLASPRNVPSPRSTSGSRRQHLQLPSQLSIPPVSVYNGGSDSNSLYPSYNNMLSADMVPDPSPHHEVTPVLSYAPFALDTVPFIFLLSRICIILGLSKIVFQIDGFWYFCMQ